MRFFRKFILGACLLSVLQHVACWEAAGSEADMETLKDLLREVDKWHDTPARRQVYSGHPEEDNDSTSGGSISGDIDDIANDKDPDSTSISGDLDGIPYEGPNWESWKNLQSRRLPNGLEREQPENIEDSAFDSADSSTLDERQETNNKSRCVTGKWSEWGPCLFSEHCTKQKRLPKLFHPAPTTELDEGDARMKLMMKNKARVWENTQQCVRAGTCPEGLMKPMSGAYKCGSNGVAGDMPCHNVDQLGFVSFEEMTGTREFQNERIQGNDVWGWTDPVTNDEYAIMGHYAGTSFVRITDPENPLTVGFLETASLSRGGGKSWRDIKVVRNHAYIVSEVSGHGLQVFDLTRLRGITRRTVFKADAVNTQFGQAHNVIANAETNFIYVVGVRYEMYVNCHGRNHGGLMAFDVSNPLNPRLAGCYGADGYTHDAECVVYRGPDTRYYGKEICFAYNQDTITIVDVSDKNHMVFISKTGYQKSGYTHQGTLTEDHKLLLLDDELDEMYASKSCEKYTKTFVWDVTDLRNPVVRSIFRSAETAVDHNQYVVGNYVYQANYEAGLRILHLDKARLKLTQVGYFDVHPSSTKVDFNGAWSVYPYFKSGTVVVSSINYGLFIVKPNLSKMSMAMEKRTLDSGMARGERTRTRRILSVEDGEVCPPLTETQECMTSDWC